jgi:hypothetical protein
MRSRAQVEEALHKIATIDHAGYELKPILAVRESADADAEANAVNQGIYIANFS